MSLGERDIAKGRKSGEAFLADVLTGLGMQQKTLPCKYLYDSRGSLLFEAICDLEEYYPTRTELSILEANAADIAQRIGPRALIIEYGSGTSRKTRLLLDALHEPSVYIPIDISRSTLLGSADALAKTYPTLAVFPLCADYTRELTLPKTAVPSDRTVIFFPGSTIGNFEPREVADFLGRMAADAGSGGGVLIGVDLEKSATRLESAYDDARGITAMFNLNLLRRINRELDADFQEADFQHAARWNAEKSRVEMHLVSQKACSVTVGAKRFAFAKGESIHTENAYKYRLEAFATLAAKAGLVRNAIYTDPDRLFSVQYFEVS